MLAYLGVYRARKRKAKDEEEEQMAKEAARAYKSKMYSLLQEDDDSREVITKGPAKATEKSRFAIPNWMEVQREKNMRPTNTEPMDSSTGFI